MPALKVVGEVVVLLVAPHDIGLALIKEGEGAAGTADVDRLPQPVQHQHMPVEQRLHGRKTGYWGTFSAITRKIPEGLFSVKQPGLRGRGWRCFFRGAPVDSEVR